LTIEYGKRGINRGQRFPIRAGLFYGAVVIGTAAQTSDAERSEQPADSAGEAGRRPEIRNPKTEGNPKSEIRNPKSEIRNPKPEWDHGRRLRRSDFGFSDSFGFRVSDFGFSMPRALAPFAKAQRRRAREDRDGPSPVL
jgi:hypothetical protein